MDFWPTFLRLWFFDVKMMKLFQQQNKISGPISLKHCPGLEENLHTELESKKDDMLIMLPIQFLLVTLVSDGRNMDVFTDQLLARP